MNRMVLHDIIKWLNENNEKSLEYNDCIDYLYLNLSDYESILRNVLNLKEKPKRVIDIGSCLNAYGYLFNNYGIDYIGIDINKRFTPYISENTFFINEKYENIKENYKNDVIISNLCVGYLVPIEEVKAKHFITKDKVWW